MSKDDYANWMGSLPKEFLHLPLNHLAIPGSHDSATYEIERAIAPDAPPVVRMVPYCCSVRWAKCQNLNICQQLKAGIRYFDLRVACRENRSENVYFTHSLYGPPVPEVLGEIRAFLDGHKMEVVLLDFNHFYGFTQDLHRELVTILETAFRGLLCPKSTMADVTLSKLRQLNQQVIIFYQNGGGHHLWPTESIFSCWPDTMRVCKVLIRDAQEEWKSKLLEKRKKANPEEVFGVYQTVLTPTRWTCAKFWGSVQTKCAEAINPRLGEWMRAGQAAMIYIADFVDQPGDFVESVLSLNRSAIGGRDFATAAEPGSLQQLTRGT